MSLLSQVADALKSASSALAKKEAELERKRERLQFLKKAPLSKDDEIARIRNYVDRAKCAFAENVAGVMDGYRDRPLNDFSNLAVLPLLSHRHAPNPTPRAEFLLAVHADQVMDAVRESVDRMDWPANVGPSPADRRKEISELEPAIKKLENDIRDMRTQVRQVGATSL